MQFVARSKGNCPGTPPEIAQKVNEYVEWKDRFDANSAAVLNSMVQAQAQEIAEAPLASTEALAVAPVARKPRTKKEKAK